MSRAVAFTLVASISTPAAFAEPPVAWDDPPERVYFDTLDAAGNLTGGSVLMPRPRIDRTLHIPANVEVLWGPGHGDNPNYERIDIVILGDGYQAHELGAYATHAQSAVAALFSREPFRTYSQFFRVYRVDVISADSGVDHDPVFGIYRDTALDMGFWCNGTERLLCVNVNWAWQYVPNTPWGADQLLCIANSTKYGGAGYTASNAATVAGGNAAAAEIAIHEFGHSIGNLADEYFTTGTVYGGPEVPEANSTILTALGMSSFQSKWHRWLTHNDANFDGLVGAFQGCRYFAQGINRPTNNSLMRNLGRPFNMPSVEALIAEFYSIVRPIENTSHLTTQRLDGTERLWVDTVDLQMPQWWGYQWSLNGSPIPGAVHPDLDLSTLGLPPGRHTLRVEVVDNTPWVRDPAIRASRMTEDRQWTVCVAAPCYACNCNTSTGVGVCDIFDFLCFQNLYAQGAPYACNCNTSTGVGVCDIFDFLCFQNQYAQGCGRQCP